MSVTLNAREIHGLIKEKKAFARSKKQEVASWCENFKKVNGKDPSSSDKREIKGMIDEYNAVKREYDELKAQQCKQALLGWKKGSGKKLNSLNLKGSTWGIVSTGGLSSFPESPQLAFGYPSHSAEYNRTVENAVKPASNVAPDEAARVTLNAVTAGCTGAENHAPGDGIDDEHPETNEEAALAPTGFQAQGSRGDPAAPDAEKNNDSSLGSICEKAEAGKVEAQYNLGVLYFSGGQGVEKDEAQAAEWLLKAAQQGDSPAMCLLGYMYEHGRGVAQSDKEALQWTRAAAEKGSPEAQFNLTLMEPRSRAREESPLGEPPTPNQEEALSHGALGDRGDAADEVEARYESGVRLMHGSESAAPDPPGALQLFLEAGKAGNLDSQCILGYMYERGLGVTPNLGEAVRWTKAAAEQGSGEAMFNLGVLYQRGLGVDKDDAQAVAWFRKASGLGVEEARTNLSAMKRLGRAQRTTTGDDFEQLSEDRDEILTVDELIGQRVDDLVNSAMRTAGACTDFSTEPLGPDEPNNGGGSGMMTKPVDLRALEARAEGGDVQAQCILGLLRERGDVEGVGQDLEAAARHTRAAADQGCPEALFNLGVLYERGRGLPRSDAEAARCFRSAALGGVAEARANLEVMVAQGRAAPPVSPVSPPLGGRSSEETAGCDELVRQADRGSRRAMCALGYMYERGLGVTPNLGEAVRWTKAAAELGSGEAMFNLGVLYQRGHGVAKDESAALRLFREASELGLPEAKANFEYLRIALKPGAVSRAELAVLMYLATGEVPTDADVDYVVFKCGKPDSNVGKRKVADEGIIQRSEAGAIVALWKGILEARSKGGDPVKQFSLAQKAQKKGACVVS